MANEQNFVPTAVAHISPGQGRRSRRLFLIAAVCVAILVGCAVRSAAGGLSQGYGENLLGRILALHYSIADYHIEKERNLILLRYAKMAMDDRYRDICLVPASERLYAYSWALRDTVLYAREYQTYAQRTAASADRIQANVWELEIELRRFPEANRTALQERIKSAKHELAAMHVDAKRKAERAKVYQESVRFDVELFELGQFADFFMPCFRACGETCPVIENIPGFIPVSIPEPNPRTSATSSTKDDLSVLADKSLLSFHGEDQ